MVIVYLFLHTFPLVLCTPTSTRFFLFLLLRPFLLYIADLPEISSNQVLQVCLCWRGTVRPPVFKPSRNLLIISYQTSSSGSDKKDRPLMSNLLGIMGFASGVGLQTVVICMNTWEKEEYTYAKRPGSRKYLKKKCVASKKSMPIDAILVSNLGSFGCVSAEAGDRGRKGLNS